MFQGSGFRPDRNNPERGTRNALLNPEHRSLKPVLPLLLRFGIPFLLCWLLLGSGLLAWRRWRDRPWLAAVTGALVVALAAILFHTKWLAVAAVIAGIAALSLVGRGVRR